MKYWLFTDGILIMAYYNPYINWVVKSFIYPKHPVLLFIAPTCSPSLFVKRNSNPFVRLAAKTVVQGPDREASFVLNNDDPETASIRRSLGTLDI